MSIEQKDVNENIVSKGAENVSLTKVTINYLIENMGVVDKIKEHPYDVHIANISFKKIFKESDKVDINGLNDILYQSGVKSLYKAVDTKLLTISECGITFNDKSPLDKTSKSLSMYETLNRYVSAYNKFIDQDRVLESQAHATWLKNYTEMCDYFDNNFVKNKLNINYLKKLNASISSKGKKINSVLEKYEDKCNKKPEKEYKYAKKIISLMYEINDFIYSNLYLYNDSNKKFRENRFVESLTNSIGFNLPFDINHDKVEDSEYVLNMLYNYYDFLLIFQCFLQDLINECNHNKINKLTDVFKLDTLKLKTISLNQIDNQFDSYDEEFKFNLNIFYNFFRDVIFSQVSRHIILYVDGHKTVSNLFQYLPLPSMAICFAISLSLTISYNFTLLKEIWERNNLLIIYLFILLSAILITINLVFNIIKFKKIKNSSNEELVKKGKYRKNYSIVSIVSYSLITCILFGLNIFYIFRYDGYDNNYYYVNDENNGIIIDDLVNKNNLMYTIPETIDDKKVTKISKNVFANNSTIENIDLKYYKGELSEGQFQNCTSLELAILPNDNKYLPNNIFDGCYNLTSVANTYYVEQIGDMAFNQCRSLKEFNANKIISIGKNCFSDAYDLKKFTTNYGIDSIDDYAFKNCSSLNEISIGNKITRIGDSAFSHTNIKNIDLPESLIYIGNNAFEDCNINDVIIHDSASFGEYKFNNCFPNYVTNVIYYNKTVPSHFFEDAYISEFNSINGVELIGESSFKNSKIYKFTTDDYFIAGEGAFYNCKGLNLQLPLLYIKGEIKPNTFAGCESADIIINQNVTSIGHNAFDGVKPYTFSFDNNCKINSLFDIFGDSCSHITTVNYSNNDVIPDDLFFACSSLSTINFTNEVKKIGNYSFGCCNSLKLSPMSSVEEIGSYAFQNCTFDNSFSDMFPNVNYIGNNSFNNASFANSKIILSPYIHNVGDNAFSSLKGNYDVQLNTDLNNIGDKIFKGTIINKVYLADNISQFKKLFDSARVISIDLTIVNGDCTVPELLGSTASTIERIVIKNNSDTIIDNMFNGCQNLNEISLQNEVTKVGNSAFYNCNNLESFPIEKLIFIGDNAFECTALSYIKFNDKIKSIGERAFYGTNIKNIAVSPNINYIGEHAFYSNNDIDQIAVPLLNSESFSYYINPLTVDGYILCSITRTDAIPDNYFKGCNLHLNFDFNGIKDVGNEAFEGNVLYTVKLIENGYIGTGAFKNCEIKELYLNTTEIPSSAFEHAEITKFYNSENIIRVNDRAFANARIPNIDLSYCKYVGNSAFWNTGIHLSNLSMPHIGEYAFSKCFISGVIDLTNSEYVGENAFANIGVDYIYKPNVKISYSKNKNLEYYFGPNTYGEMFNGITVIDAAYIKSDYFKNIKNVKNIIIMGSVQSIEDETFAFGKVESIQLPDTIKYIGEKAFYNCGYLRKINIPDSIIRIEKMAFNQSLLGVFVSLPKHIQYIGDNAFDNRTMIYNDSRDTQMYIDAWALRWDGKSDSSRFWNKLGYFEREIPEAFYPVLILVILCILAIVIIPPVLIVLKKKGKLKSKK